MFILLLALLLPGASDAYRLIPAKTSPASTSTLLLSPSRQIGPKPPISTRLWASKKEKTDAATLAQQQYKLPDLSQAAFPDIPDEPYDLIVLGSGPAGETAAVRAAQLGQRVAIVEVKKAFGGPTGLTSKAVREAAKRICKTVEQIGGDRTRQIRRLWTKRFPALKSEAEVFQAAETRERLTKNACDLFIGSALLVKSMFDDTENVVTVRVCRPTGCVELETRFVVIATGSRPSRPKELRPGLPIPYTSKRVIDSTQMSSLKDLPDSLAVIGGGVIGVEYATVFAQLGIPATVVCKENRFLPFLPTELSEACKADMMRNGIEFRHSPIKTFEVTDDKIVQIGFEDGGQLEVDVLLYSGGRDANSEKIGCENVGVEIGKYGRIVVDSDYRTANPRIFAIGDVIGPPGLASFAQQSARYVTDLLFSNKGEGRSERSGRSGPTMGMNMGIKQAEVELEDWADDDFFSAVVAEEEQEEKERARTISMMKRMEAPLTLWTFPEIASVGQSVEEALADGHKIATEDEGSIVSGYAYYRDLARGRLSGDLNGFLKIIARADSPTRHVIIGVHCVGETANELIQLGSVMVMAGTTLEELSSTPFAAVTLSCLYQIASDDALCNSPRNPLYKTAGGRAKAAAAAKKAN